MDRQYQEAHTSGFPFLQVILLLACIAIWLLAGRFAMRIADRDEAYRAERQTAQALGNGFAEGVTVDGIPIGGWSMEQAR